ncbi:hypothetical protein HDV63DRAFT_385322 [Trichoderma sp. SZMC 28014]
MRCARIQCLLASVFVYCHAMLSEKLHFVDAECRAQRSFDFDTRHHRVNLKKGKRRKIAVTFSDWKFNSSAATLLHTEGEKNDAGSGCGP